MNEKSHKVHTTLYTAKEVRELIDVKSQAQKITDARSREMRCRCNVIPKETQKNSEETEE